MLRVLTFGLLILPLALPLFAGTVQGPVQLWEKDGRLRGSLKDCVAILEPIEAPELRRRLKLGEVTLIDVRPDAEYRSGHIAGALSVPLETLQRRLRAIPKRQPVVAYCRGPYCVLAVEAVARLRRRGYTVRRFADGFPGWKADGLPVRTGTDR